ncbi:hypothetical protein ACQP00_20050 [Dactylosporangium sp. CS-047395]|uniref:hypothetical protein n=1 Tax=Dactylosporangium sp. CS-047395 TaxID=3239936 RepID=UPI003D8C8A07
MPYTAQISRSSPTCFVFLVDQSASMDDRMGGEDAPGGQGGQRKADVVADALNRLLLELTIRCTKEEAVVRDYFHIAVIGYGARVGTAFAGSLAERDVAPISVVAEQSVRIEPRTKKVPDGAGGLVETTVRFPIWVDPVADGATPMTQALTYARHVVDRFVQQHPDCFPPVVLNLTDGMPTDGDAGPAAAALRAVASSDGNVLLFNLHISDAGGQKVLFPDHDGALPDEYARSLFAMSSVLPSHMRGYAMSQDIKAGEAARGFGYNADIIAIVQFLEIGTRASDLR